MKKEWKKLYILASVLSIAAVFILFSIKVINQINSSPGQMIFDEFNYYQISLNEYNHLVSHKFNIQPFYEATHKGPIYPFFPVIIYLFFPINQVTAHYGNLIISFFTVFLIFWIESINSKKRNPAFFGVYFLLLIIPYARSLTIFLADIAFAPCILLLIIIVNKLLEKDSFLLRIALGIVCGIIILIKPMGLLFLVWPIGFFAWKGFKEAGLKASLIKIMPSLMTFIIVCAFWFVPNLVIIFKVYFSSLLGADARGYAPFGNPFYPPYFFKYFTFFIRDIGLVITILFSISTIVFLIKKEKTNIEKLVFGSAYSMLILLTLVQLKYDRYIWPIFPLLALCIGFGFSSFFKKKRQVIIFSLLLTIVNLILLLPCSLNNIEPDYENAYSNLTKIVVFENPEHIYIITRESQIFYSLWEQQIFNRYNGSISMGDNILKNIPENFSFKNTLFLIAENEEDNYPSDYNSAAKLQYEHYKNDAEKLPLELIYKTRINADRPGNYSLYRVKSIS